MLARQQSDIAHIYAQQNMARAQAAMQGGAQAMQASQAASGQGAAQNFQGDQAAAAQQHQSQMQNVQLGAQAGMQENQLAAQARMQQGQQQGQQALQQQHYNLQQQLSQSQLSQSEALRLQRLRSAMGTLQEQVDSGNLSQEDANQLGVQIQTGINPLAAREARSRVQAQDLQIQQMQTQMGHADALWGQQQEYRSSSLQDRLQTMVDPATGLEQQFYMDQHGQPHPLEFGGGGTGGGRAGSRRSSTGGTGGGASNEPEAIDSDTLMTHARHIALANAGRDQAGHPNPVSVEQVMSVYRQLQQELAPAATTRVDPAQVRQQLWQEISQSFPEMSVQERRSMLTHALPGRLQEEQQTAQNSPAARETAMRRQAAQVADQLIQQQASQFPQEQRQQAMQQLLQQRPALIQQIMARQQQPAAQPQTTQNASGQTMYRSGPQAQWPPPQRTPQEGPFNPEAPRESLTTRQQATTDDLDRLRDLARSSLSGENQEAHLNEIDQALNIFSRYGSLPAMEQQSPRDFAYFTRIMNRMATLRRPRPVRPQQTTNQPSTTYGQAMGYQSQYTNR